MAVTLVGEVVNTSDAITGFNAGNISGDDDFVQGTGAIGLKAAVGLNEIYTTSLGATAPYNFSSGGTEFGWHIIMWFNTKTPIDGTTGLQIIVGNGTDRARWSVTPIGFYKGGFVNVVVNSARNFDAISAGTWTLTGNPAQLTNVTQVGGAFNMTTSLMGNFNNIQLDQFTIGLGVRVDAGTVGAPNTFSTVRTQDELTSIWGWWSVRNGAFLGKGKLFIGPSTGSTTSVFTDSAFSVIFANERVAVGFYEIAIRGAGTTVTWNLGNIAAASAANARWSLTVDSTTGSFSDTNSVWSGANTLTLSANCTLTGTTLINCNSVIQNSAVLNSITALNANTLDGVAFIQSNNPSNISNCKFEFSNGHAIEIKTPGTYTFSGNEFTGYGANSSTDAAVYNNSGGLVTLNITNASSPTIRNGIGASTTINISVDLEINGLTEGSQAIIIGNGGAEDGVILLQGYANASGIVSGSFGGSTPQNVIIRARNGGIIAGAIQDDGGVFTDFTSPARTSTGGVGIGSTNDVSLTPIAPAVGDAFYFGGINSFGKIDIHITTAGAGYSGIWEYFNGGWATLSVVDNSNQFKSLGYHSILFSKPNDWTTTSVNAQGPYYYVRFRINSITTPSQALCDSIALGDTKKYQPFQGSGTILGGSGLTTTVVWIEDLINA